MKKCPFCKSNEYQELTAAGMRCCRNPECKFAGYFLPIEILEMIKTPKGYNWKRIKDDNNRPITRICGFRF